MRILDDPAFLFESERRYRAARVDKLGFAANRLLKFREISLHPLAGDQDEIRAFDLLDVQGRRLEVVRIDSRLHDGNEPYRIATHALRDVGRNGRKRRNRELCPRGQQERNRQREKADQCFHNDNDESVSYSVGMNKVFGDKFDLVRSCR